MNNYHYRVTYKGKFSSQHYVERNPYTVKLRCDERFPHAFTACGCKIKLVGSNQGNLIEKVIVFKLNSFIYIDEKSCFLRLILEQY